MTENGSASKPDPAFGLSRLAFIAAQLGLLVLLLRELDMLTPAFRRIVYVAVPAFLVHHFLPGRFRLTFFLALSLGCMLLVLGIPPDAERYWDASLAFPRTAAILGVGLAIITVCRLPLGFWTRAALLLLGGGIAAVFRSGLWSSGGLEIVWILIAAMFMFRVIVYLYDVSTNPARPTWAQSLSYFFLIPNICCTLFPVIDFKTFCRSHYNEAALGIYQRGVQWMFRGAIQMLIYRYIEQLLFIKASAVDSGGSLLKYLLTNSFLYLNVSGQFHLIVGLLLLFGFNLPATNHNYFLAESFTDYWRRVNIYWKDFILKIFYYPIYFRLKNRGATIALVVATLWAFFVTWLLHLYQTWWLKGSASASWPDTLFWLILGLLILANSLWEMKRGRKRTLATSRITLGEATALALRTAGTFAAICLLWSLWSSPSLEVWFGLWKHISPITVLGMAAVLVGIAAAKVILEIWPLWRNAATARASVARPPGFQRDLWQCAVPLVVVVVLVACAVRGVIPDPHLERIQPRLNSILVFGVLEAGDSFPPNRGLSERNYYQQLTSVDEGNRQLWEMLCHQMVWKYVDWRKRPVADVEDSRLEIMKPLARGSFYEVDDFQTNRWGMRDHDYSLEKPSDTVRIAVLGSSHTMGYAVSQHEVFETLLEEQLNRASTAGENKFEVLNFAHVLYGPLQQVAVLEKKVRAFKPDVVILVGHLRDSYFANYQLRTAAKRRYPLPPELNEILHQARVIPELHDGLAEKRVQPFEPALLDWAFVQIVAACHDIGAKPVYFFLPAPGLELPLTEIRRALAEQMKAGARTAGFTVWDGTETFATENLDNLITGIIPHCNPRAHALIADRLYRFVSSDPVLRTSFAEKSPEHTGPSGSHHD